MRPEAPLTLVRSLVEALEAPQLDRFLAFLSNETDAAQPRAPRSLPVLAHLDTAAAAAPAPATAILQLLLDGRDTLYWGQTYRAEDFGPDFLNRYGWTEFLGPRGPIPCEELACGVLMLAPNTTYPAHAHEAEELYIPLTGTAQWWRAGENWTDRPPLSVIHHSSWVPHGTRTGDQPLITLYFWRGGDLGQKSQITG